MPNWKPPTPDPTEEQIREACQRIQSTWTAAERRKRSCYPVVRVMAPTVDAVEIFGEDDRGEGR